MFYRTVVSRDNISRLSCLSPLALSLGLIIITDGNKNYCYRVDDEKDVTTVGLNREKSFTSPIRFNTNAFTSNFCIISIYIPSSYNN